MCRQFFPLKVALCYTFCCTLISHSVKTTCHIVCRSVSALSRHTLHKTSESVLLKAYLLSPLSCKVGLPWIGLP